MVKLFEIYREIFNFWIAIITLALFIEFFRIILAHFIIIEYKVSEWGAKSATEIHKSLAESSSCPLEKGIQDIQVNTMFCFYYRN